MKRRKGEEENGRRGDISSVKLSVLRVSVVNNEFQ
jgi:hypothetical protein